VCSSDLHILVLEGKKVILIVVYNDEAVMNNSLGKKMFHYKNNI